MIKQSDQELELKENVAYGPIIRGEPERAPNTRGTGSGFIYIYLYVCGVIISVRRELNFERVR